MPSWCRKFLRERSAGKTAHQGLEHDAGVLEMEEEESMEQGRRVITGALWLGMLGLLLIPLSRFSVVDLDLFHELALIREAIEIGTIPRHDSFAYTTTVDPVVHHEWGTGALLYLVVVTTGFGPSGLIGVKALLSTAIVVGAYRCARRSKATDALLALGTPLVVPLVCIGFTTVRAQLFTLTLMVFLLMMLQRDRQGGRRWIFWWLLLYVIWLNLHAGFVVGVGILGLHTVEQFLRSWAETRSIRKAWGEVVHLIGMGLLMIPMALMNPFGVDYLNYLARAIPMERPLIREWEPLLSPPLPLDRALGFSFSILLALYGLWIRGLRNTPGLLLVTVTAFLAFQHIRHMPLYGLVWFCHVPGWLQETPVGRRLSLIPHRHPAGVIGGALVFALLGLLMVLMNRTWVLQVPTERRWGNVLYPAGVVEYLDNQGFQGNLYTPFRMGAYVSWHLAPDVLVSFDSRYEVAYPPAALEANFRFYDAKPGWQSTLEEDQTDAILVPRWTALAPQLERFSEESDSWKLVYIDDQFFLFVCSERGDDLILIDRSGSSNGSRFP